MSQQSTICILALFFFIITIGTLNGIVANPSGNESEYFVSIFSNSYKVFNQQMDIWGYEDKSKEWICSYALHDWQRDDAMFLMAFPREWMGNGTTPPHQCEWQCSYAARLGCYDGKHSSIRVDYVDADIYEPTRSLTSEMVTNVIHALYSECFINDSTKFKIRIYTNFAEKILVKRLNELGMYPGRLVESIQLFATSVAAANYYYYALADPSILHVFDEYVYKLNEIILNRHWHQIYLFALSQNLTEDQLVNVVNAAKKPMSLYFFQNHRGPKDERIAVMLVSPLLRRLNVPYQFCDTRGMHIESCFPYIQLSRDLTIESKLFEENWENMTRMFTGAVENFNFHIFGAQLPAEQIGDAVRVPVQPKARIVLITDFVEKKFLDKLATADRNRFEIKIYALNNEIYHHYQGKADVVTLVNPNNPGLIPFGRNESEPIYYISEVNPFANNFVIVAISTGTAILLAISFIIFCIIYRRRLHHVNWLHRLEQFKTEHLYAAYMNKNTVKNEENIDHWELGWDQVVLTTEHLGRGAFGEVRKANLIGMASSTKTTTKMDCTKLQEEMEVAVKILPKHASNRARQSFLREIQMMKLLDNGHRCIVQMLGCMSRSQLALVLEFCPGGSLLEHVRKLAPKGEWVEGEEEREMDPVKMCRPFPRWAWQIADAMAFLASKHLVHRDLAARNVLLDAEMVAKICDFGHCIAVEAANDADINVEKAMDDVEMPKSNENGGEEVRKEDDGEEKEKMPIRWLAPECLERKIYSEKSDVWSFGVILHEIYTFGTNPFDGIEHKELLNYIRQYIAQKPEMCPEKTFGLMQQCFGLEPKQRPNFIEIRNKLTRIIEEETGEYGYLALD